MRRDSLFIGLLGLGVMVVTLAFPRVSEACICGLPGGFPQDGDTEVPTNAVLVFPSDFVEAPVLRNSNGTDIPTLMRSETGFVLDATWFILTPIEALAPEAEYQLVGRYRTLGFKTATGPQVLTPAPATVTNLFSSHTVGLESCPVTSCTPSGDEISIARLQYQPSPNAAYYELILTTKDQTWRRLVSSSFQGTLGGFCSNTPTMSAETEVCAELIAVAANGARSAQGGVTCSDTRECELNHCDFDENYRSCHQPEFSPGPIEALTTPSDSGGCQVSSTKQGYTSFLFFLTLLGLGKRVRIRINRRSSQNNVTPDKSSHSSTLTQPLRPAGTSSRFSFLATRVTMCSGGLRKSQTIPKTAKNLRMM